MHAVDIFNGCSRWTHLCGANNKCCVITFPDQVFLALSYLQILDDCDSGVNLNACLYSRQKGSENRIEDTKSTNI